MPTQPLVNKPEAMPLFYDWRMNGPSLRENLNVKRFRHTSSADVFITLKLHINTLRLFPTKQAEGALVLF